jgi:DNA-binding transcriptional LysR family regulator
MDRFLSMEVFVTTVESGSFTASAGLLKMTPSMVSKHLSALEKRLGTPLLQRTTRRQHLTEAGQTYYEQCKQIMLQLQAAEAGVEAMSDRPKGMLRVSASVWFGSLTLAPLACDYLKLYPEVNLQLSLTDRFVDIVDEGYDVAIRIGNLADSSLIARKLAMFEVAICASAEYLQQYSEPHTPKDLLQHQCLGFSNWHSHGGWKRVSPIFGTHTLSLRFESDNVQALRAAALKGLGIILMPRALLQDDIVAGRLIELLPAFTPPARPIHAVYPRNRQTQPKLTSFVDYLMKVFSEYQVSGTV